VTAMFPASGSPSSDAANSLPTPITANCNPLWYSTSRCQPRFDPAAANAVISELVNLINKGEIAYDCNFLNNAETSVRYLIQRGLPHAALAVAAGNDYAVTLDPPTTRYSDFLTLVVVPTGSNTGPVTINVNGLGVLPLLREDRQPLVANDFKAATPCTISYYSNAFYMTSLAASQIATLPDRSGLAEGGPFAYALWLTTPLAIYIEFMTLVIVPVLGNQGAVTLAVNGLAALPVLRNDGLPLQSYDLRAGRPAIITYYQGNFYMVGLASSQVPLTVQGGVDIWIRTDGDDATGDGSANDPTKAFQTLAGAWNKVGARYAASPLFTMRFKFGMPGAYAGAIIGPFGGKVEIWGDTANRAGYRFSSVDIGNNTWVNIWSNNVTLSIYGMTFVRDVPPPILAGHCLLGDQSTTTITDCDFDSTVANTQSTFINLRPGGLLGTGPGTYNFYGRNLTIQSFIACQGGVWTGCTSILGAVYRLNDLPTTGGTYNVASLGVVQWNGAISTVIGTNITGTEHFCATNAILNYGGTPLMGSSPGVVSTGGQVVP